MKKFLFRHREKHHDVFNDVRKNVVSLRPRAVHLEFSAFSVHRAYQKHRLIFLGGSICAIVFVTFGIYRSITWANSAVLYPSTCLGGWNNPQLAEGKPDIVGADDLSAFTEANSAVLPANASSDIFCGGFTGDISQEVQPTKVTLTFSWTAKVQEASSTPLAPIIFTDVPIDASSSPDTSSTSPTVVVPIPDAGATPDSPVILDSPPPVPPSDAPVSFLDFFIPRVRAADNGFLDVSYTLDGNTWQDMGTIDALHMTSASFDISVASSTSWKDMANLQVRIRSISSLDPTPTVYLDGMLLTAEYENSLQKESAVATSTAVLDVPIDSASSTPLSLDKSIFSADEQSTVSVHPQFNDGSTNIAFYAQCPTVACPNDGTLGSPKFVFFAENSGHGDLPFSDYWAPDPSFHNIVAVEYFNDAQQFSCSNLSLADCIADSHFIRQFSFDIVAGASTTASSSDATIVE